MKMKKRDKNGKIIRKPKAILKKKPIIDKCEPCVLRDEISCNVYLDPTAKWRNDRQCPMLAKSRFIRRVNKRG